MDNSAYRHLVNQLAEDLGWLEEHCRQRPEQAAHAGQLRLAAALARNCVGPFLDRQPPTPIHIAVVGGAGAKEAQEILNETRIRVVEFPNLGDLIRDVSKQLH